LRTYVVGVDLSVTIGAPDPVRAAVATVAALDAAGFSTAIVSDVLDVDQPLPIGIVRVGGPMAFERCGGDAAGKLLDGEAAR
jgi:hypothetical protein